MRILEGKGVTKYFGGLAAISNVDFDVDHGEIVGLIGPNGAGKTTLFNLISAALALNAGVIRFKGETISGLKPHQICRRGIARTFQVVKPLQRMTVLDNVIASAFLRAKDKAEAEQIASETLTFTNLYDDRSVISKGLPLGKRKRLEIARALATQPELLLF